MNTHTTQTARSALVIDDEPQMQRLLTIAFEANGYRVTSSGTAREGLVAAAHHRHDVIILDLGLPDDDGISVLKNLRGWTQVPILILTVQDDESGKIEALDSGADDYVTKPFNTGELLARVRAALRRTDTSKEDQPVFTINDLAVDFTNRRVTRNGELVKLTATEYALLRLFIQHAGKVLTHRFILREVWGPAHEDRTSYLRVYMTRLREKLEADPANPALFLTEPAVGYRFQV